jgi:hypothetical protein
MLCYGVWATVGSTGRWPETVNMWELEGWDGLAKNFAHEFGGGRTQDPSLAEWWAVASELRAGGVDRIVVPEPWSPTIEALTAAGPSGFDAYAHEVITTPPGNARALLDALGSRGRVAIEEYGARAIGAFHVAMRNDSEAIVLWGFPDWSTWARFERAWDGDELLGWRGELVRLGAHVERVALVDSPLNPLRTGRQPQVEDRRPLADI